jgi:hypothetical protein
MDDIPHNDRIELAIADLETQEYLNYAATARKYNIGKSVKVFDKVGARSSSDHTPQKSKQL